jgi:TonB family protein
VYKTAILVLLLTASLSVFGQSLPEPNLVSAGLPRYPPIARLAKVHGEVKVDFTLSSNGEVINATAVSGHPMLKPAAEENMKTWRFELPKESVPHGTVTLDSYRYVEVITNPPPTKQAHDCPAPDAVAVLSRGILSSFRVLDAMGLARHTH